MDWMDRGGNLWTDNSKTVLQVLYVWVRDLTKFSFKIFIKPELLALIGSVITRPETRQMKYRNHLVVSTNFILTELHILQNWRFDQIWLDKNTILYDSFFDFIGSDCKSTSREANLKIIAKVPSHIKYTFMVIS